MKISILKSNIDKLGTIGLFITALFSPCCFPLFAFGASALGLGSFELFGGWTMWIFMVMVFISVIGFYISYTKHNSMYPLIIAILSAGLIFFGFFANNYISLIYIGMLGILIATIVNYYQNKLQLNNNISNINTNNGFVNNGTINITNNINYLIENDLLFDDYTSNPIGPFAVINIGYEQLLNWRISSVPLNNFAMMKKRQHENCSRISVAVNHKLFKEYFDKMLSNEKTTI